MAKKKEDAPVAKFDKAQILASVKYKNRRDLLAVILSDNKKYSHEEVANKINDFMKMKGGM